MSVRRSDDVVDCAPLSEVRRIHFDEAVPWRRFRWYKGQRHFSGSYWSATMRAVIGYESRLELANLLLADFDPRVTWILSQPFLLEGDDCGKHRKHIPDYLLVYADGSLGVVDVKPSSKLAVPKVRDSLGWSGRALEEHGWEYQVQCEPDPIMLANVRFVAGYRRHFQFVDSEIGQARDELNVPSTIGEAVRKIVKITAAPGLARCLVLHLIWTQQLRVDLSIPLNNLSIVEIQ